VVQKTLISNFFGWQNTGSGATSANKFKFLQHSAVKELHRGAYSSNLLGSYAGQFATKCFFFQ
jgi:hypothetical protein